MSLKRQTEASDEGAHRGLKRPSPSNEDSQDQGMGLTPEEEERLFRLWVKASQCQARSAIDPRNREARDAFLDAEAEYSKETDRLLASQSLLYDPNRRSVVEYLKGLDCVTSKLWFQYRPVAREGGMAHDPVEQPTLTLARRPKALRRKYDLRILSEETKKNRLTMDTLEQYQIRRFFGAFPTRVAILGPQPAATPPPEPTVSEGVELRTYLWPIEQEENGKAAGACFNEAFERAVGDGCELLIVLCMGSKGGEVMADGVAGVVKGVDLFFPAYPVLLRHALVLTPIQVLQVNGCDPMASDVGRSLLDRIAGILGAVLEPRERDDRAAASSSRGQSFDAKAWLEAGGLSTRGAGDGEEEEEKGSGITTDPRVCRVRPGLVKYVPRCAHGWLSIDTKTLLAVALDVYQPKAVLELGSWYGLSSRFILERSVKGCQFYAADWFKNNAHYGRRMDGVNPLDKLYQRHLRYETFCANVDPWLQHGEASCFTVRMDIHETVTLFDRHKVPLDMVFIDAEKHTARLVDLLRRVMAAFPSAVIVGDDYVFDSVKQAIAELGVGQERLVTRDESYLIVPEGQDNQAALQAMARLEPQYVLAGVHKCVCELIEGKKYDEAIKAAEEGGLGLTGELYSPGKTTLHEICRQKDAAALDVLDKYCQAAVSVPLNELGLTPFDYFTHKINFS